MNVLYDKYTASHSNVSSMERMLSRRLTLDLDKFISSHSDADADTLAIENFVKNICFYRIEEMGFSVSGEIECLSKDYFYQIVAHSDDVGRIVFAIDKPMALCMNSSVDEENYQLN